MFDRRIQDHRFVSSIAIAMTTVCIAAPAVHAGFITIDDFTDTNATWPIEVFTGQPSDGNSETGVAGVLGGNRSTTLSNGTFQTELDRASVTIAPSVQTGVLDYNSTLFAASDLTLVYGINAPAFDFSGQAGIVVDFIGFDFPDDGPLQINMLLTSNGESMTASTVVSDIGSGEVLVSFDDLGPLRGVFDLASVDDLALEFVASAGSDFRIDNITTRLPTPGALALFGIGLLGARSQRRRD